MSCSSTKSPKAGTQRLSVGFILAKRFTLCAFANFIDVLRLAADEGDRSRQILCDWSVISETIEPIASSCGINVLPTSPLGDPARFDYIVVVGGLIDEIPNVPRAQVAFLRGAAAAKVALVGVCTGAFILHRLGLLDDYRCCVSWFHHADFLEQFDGLRPVSDQIFVVDDDRLTCSGGASSAHLAAYLVERHIGRAQARKSLHIMMITEALAADEPQAGTPLEIPCNDVLVRKALLAMQQGLDTPLRLSQIAARLSVSVRRLERRFQADLKMSPTAARRLIRVQQAQFLLRTTGQSVAEIAVGTGFADTSHLVRTFRRALGTTPAAYREQAAAIR